MEVEVEVEVEARKRKSGSGGGGRRIAGVQVQCSAMRCGQEARSLLMEAPPRLEWWVWVSAGEARVG